MYDSQKLKTFHDLDASGGVHCNDPFSVTTDVRSMKVLSFRKNDLVGDEELPDAYIVNYSVKKRGSLMSYP